MTITAPVFLDMKARTARTVSRSIVFTLCMIFKPVLLHIGTITAKQLMFLFGVTKMFMIQ